MRYVFDGGANIKEQRALEKYIGAAYKMCGETIFRLEHCTDENSAFAKIYSTNSPVARRTIADALKRIERHICSGLKIRRKHIYKNSDGRENRQTLASANLQCGEITIYDAFFSETVGGTLDDRATVLIHETAHLEGLVNDTEQNDISSAEALRNFILLACEIVGESELFAGDKHSADKQPAPRPSDTELPYNPNHYPAGTPDGKGGQFAPKNGVHGFLASLNRGTQKSESPNEKISRDNHAQKQNPQSSDTPVGTTGKQNPQQQEEEELKSEEQQTTQRQTKTTILATAEDNTQPPKIHPTAKASLNIVNGSIFSERVAGGSRRWGAADLTITGLPPNKRMALILPYTYSFNDKKLHPEKTIATIIDVQTDKNGKVFIRRIGLIGEYREEDIKDKNEKVIGSVKTADKCKSKVINIKIKIFAVEGLAYNLYFDIKKIKIDEITQSVCDKFGLGLYPVIHASYPESMLPYEYRPTDYYGGGSYDFTIPEDAELVGEFELVFDEDTQTTKVVQGEVEKTATGYDDAKGNAIREEAKRKNAKQ